MERRHWLASGLTGILAITVWSCGGGGSPMNPTPPDNSPPVETTTITITSAGVSPKNIIVNAGAKITFVNSDSQTHEPSSNPHPSHTQCPELNIGTLGAGQTRESGATLGGRTCGFHDHLNASNTAMQGSIQVR